MGYPGHLGAVRLLPFDAATPVFGLNEHGVWSRL
jgi:hypothetical protein